MPQNLCPIGLNAIEKLNLDNVNNLIKKYKEHLSSLKNVEAKAEAKIENIIKVFELLAQIDILTGKAGKDCALDLMDEFNQLYFWLADPNNSKVLIVALEAQIKKDKDKKSSNKHTILNDALTHLYSPLMLKNVAHALHGLEKSKTDKKYHFSDLEKLVEKVSGVKNDTRVSLETKLNELIILTNHTTFNPTYMHFPPRYIDKEKDKELKTKLDKKQAELTLKNFNNHEMIINQTISILKDPDFKNINNKENIELCLYNLLFCYGNKMQKTIRAAKSLQSQLTEQKYINDLVNVVANTINFAELSEKFGFANCKNAESQYIVAPSAQHTVEALGGANFKVFKITDLKTNAAVIVRGQLMTPADLHNRVSSAHLRTRVATSLNASQPSLTMQYALMPGAAEATIDYRNYEISQAISGQDLLKVFNQLHQNLNKNDETSKCLLQQNVIYFTKQILELTLLLKKAGIAFTDLKPENVLVQKNGIIKLSDVKSLIDISMLQKDSKYLAQKNQLLPLTFGYYSQDSVKIQDGKQEVDVDRLIVETICATLCKLVLQLALPNPPQSRENQFAALTNLLNPPKKEEAQEPTNDDKAPIIFEGELGQIIKQVFDMLVKGMTPAATTSLEDILKFINEKLSNMKLDLPQVLKPMWPDFTEQTTPLAEEQKRPDDKLPLTMTL